MQGYILAGLVLGSIYAISALGLVLTYSSSRIVNFAHGSTAYAVAVFYHYLNHEQGWSIPVSAAMSLLVFSPLLGLGLWAMLFRRLTHAPVETRFLATVGLWVALPAAVRIVFPFSATEVTQPQGLVRIPAEILHLDLFDLSINANQLSILIGGAAVVVGLTLLLRATPIGLATRATVDSPRSAELSGINTTLVSAGSWVVGTVLAGLAGILLSPLLGLSDVEFTLLLVASFAAAVVGRLTSLPLTFVGAMIIGLIQGVSTDFLPSTGVLNTGFKPSVPFIVMLGCLLLYQGMRRERFEIDLRSGSFEHEAPAPPRPTGWRVAVGPVAVAVALFSVPIWPGINDFWIGVVSQGVALAIIFLTFTIVTGEGGMLSLCTATLAGVGGFTAAALASHSSIFGLAVPDWFGSSNGWPLGVAILAGALMAVPVGMLVASLSLRLGGVYLALATLAFSLLMEQLVFARDEFSNFNAGVQINRPIFLGIDFNDRTNFFLLLAVIFCVVAVVVVNLRRSTTGLVLASLRSSEQGSATIGVSIVRSRLLTFAVSSFIAGLGGALYAVTIERAQPQSFNVLVGIVWLAIVVTWGVRSVLGALVAGILFAVVPQKLSFILVSIVVLVVCGLLAKLFMSKRIRHPAGAATAIGIVAAAYIGIRLLVGVEVPETVAGVATGDMPTMLFGLGAIFLSREPRGVLFNIVNRLRIAQAQYEARTGSRDGAGDASSRAEVAT